MRQGFHNVRLRAETREHGNGVRNRSRRPLGYQPCITRHGYQPWNQRNQAPWRAYLTLRVLLLAWREAGLTLGCGTRLWGPGMRCTVNLNPPQFGQVLEQLARSLQKFVHARTHSEKVSPGSPCRPDNVANFPKLFDARKAFRWLTGATNERSRLTGRIEAHEVEHMMLDRMGLDEQPMEKHGCIRSTSTAGLASTALVCFCLCGGSQLRIALLSAGCFFEAARPRSGSCAWYAQCASRSARSTHRRPTHLV